MKYIFSSFIFLSLSLTCWNGAWASQRKNPNQKSLHETALYELQVKASETDPHRIEKQPSDALNVLQSTLPADQRAESRPAWLLELGIENQKPQGALPIPSLSSFELNNLDNLAAVTLALSWQFGSAFESLWGQRWNSSLSAQLGWSFHNYQLDVPGSSQSELVKLHLLKPQLDLVVERQALSLANWNTDLWLGAGPTFGRLIQSQTSQNRDLLNTSIGENFYGFGVHSRALIAQRLSVGLKYFYRRFPLTKGSTHHAQMALGITL